METAKPFHEIGEGVEDQARQAEVVPSPWEQVANGRYMPRRIRGSCLGRELG
jgi:hypothetical protein